MSRLKAAVVPSTGEDGTPKRRPGRPRHDQPSTEFLARQEEIIDQATHVFHEKGYDAGTLDDVAEALGLRRASLYHYVQSKSHLLYLIFARGFDRALAAVDKLSEIEDPGARLAALVRHHVRMVASDPHVFGVALDHRARLRSDYEQAIGDRERRYMNVFRETVVEAGDAGIIEVVDPRHTTNALLGLTSWSYKWFDPDHDDIDMLIEACLSLIFGAAHPAVVALDQ